MLEFEAHLFADFLGKILKWEPKDRPSAQEMLSHPWLRMQPRFETKMSRNELKEFKKVHGYYVSPSSSEKSSEKGSVKEESKNDDGKNEGSGEEDGDEGEWESEHENDDSKE